MLENSPSPLAAEIAGIAAELRATANHHAAQAGARAALHALILAALARIVARLAAMFTQFQAGLLPATQRREARPQPHASVAPSGDAGRHAAHAGTARQFRATAPFLPAAQVAPLCGDAPGLPAPGPPAAAATRESSAQAPWRRSQQSPTATHQVPPPTPTACPPAPLRARPWPQAGPAGIACHQITTEPAAPICVQFVSIS